MSDRIAIMKAGRIVQTGTPTDIYYRPKNRFVAEFMGEVNVFELAEGRIVELGVDLPAGTAGCHLPAGATGCLAVRPEFLRRLAGGDGADVRFQATVANDYMLGSRTQYHLAAGKTTLVAEVAAGKAAEIATGARAEWGFDLSDAALLDE